MTNPNIVNVTTILGATTALALTASSQTLVSSSAASGKVIKIETVIVANTTTSVATVSMDLYRSSVAYYVASAISVPAYSSLSIIQKPTTIYLQEGDSLRILASSAMGTVICSYEEIS